MGRFSRVRTTALVMALGAAMVVPVPAGAGIQFLQPSDPANHEAPQFDFDFRTGEGSTDRCEGQELSYSIETFPDGGEVDEQAAGLEVTENGDGTGSFVVPDLAGGEYYFYRQCGPAEEPIRQSGGFQFSRVLLTKAVEGDVPDDATFTAAVDCATLGDPILEETRDFGSEGGSAQVVFYESEAQCEITEPAQGGAESVDIAPETLTYTEYADGASTITNTFPAAPEPTEEPTEEVEDTEDEAEPAEPVEAEPDYTG